ncbi:hypothetical protein Hanom_Chr00s000005g01612861 [Helianthus anomalus]
MCRLFMETIFQAVVLIMRLDFLHVQMLKARRTCSITSFGMKTRCEGTQKIKLIELPLTLYQHHKDMKI